MIKIAIIGRTNVGKSTLFNLLTGKKFAITSDKPGVTRDRKNNIGNILDLRFEIIDTAGIENDEDELIKESILQTDIAIKTADILLFVVDGKNGITPFDNEIANSIRKLEKHVIVCFNKAENDITRNSISTAYEMGYKDVIAISATHNMGLDGIYQTITEIFPNYLELQEKQDIADINLTIIGRPNVGKSTLINKILKENRLITSPIAGTTRDTISTNFKYKNILFKIFDTAGLRKKSNIKDSIEKMSTQETIRAVDFANIVIVVVDAETGLEKQDLTIARYAIKEGRGIFILFNKIDKIAKKDRKIFEKEMQYKLSKSLSQITNISILTTSALKEKNVSNILEQAIIEYNKWNIKIPASLLNKWLSGALAKHPLNISSGIRYKIKYINQNKTKPPTFALFVNKKEDFPENYLKYLKKEFAKSFDLNGLNIRFILKSSDNPYK